MRSVILISLFSLLCAASSEQYKSIDNAQQLTQFTQSSPLNALLFGSERKWRIDRPRNVPSVDFLVDKQQCTNEQDEKCRQQRDQIEQIADLCANDKIQFATSTNSQLAEKQFNIYGTLPKLCFFRDGLPIIYSGRKRPMPRQGLILVRFQVQFPISINSKSGSVKHGKG